jgi:hypothetical protein
MSDEVSNVSISIAYLDRLEKQQREAHKKAYAEAVKWCEENLKSDVYKIVDGKCVAIKKE